MTMATQHAPAATRTVFGHPIGLVNLFGVELWERFSFYGMLTILAGYYTPEQEFAYFGILGLVAVAAGVIVYLLSPWISRQMEGVH